MTLTGGFTGTTLDAGWTVGGTGYTPNLTAPAIDATGSGWLRMTSSATNQATYAYDTNSFAAAHATITATFNYASYNGSGADGITFFLADASKPFAVGAYGGSLGYAQKTAAGGGGADIKGMSGGYIGVGIDEYGNFSNPTEGRIGGIGATPNAIAVRGPGDGLTGYNYLGGTNGLGTAVAFPTSTTRPTGANLRTVEVEITATNQLTVFMATGGSTTFVPLYSIDLSGYTRPDQLVMGFTAGTGGSTDIHEIQAVKLTSVVSNLWTNNGGTSAWTTANNWNNTPAAAPANYSDVLLDNTFVNSAQAITVAGNQIIRNLQLDAPLSYSLSGGSLEFNSNSVTGPAGIFVSQTHGSALQTIGSNLTFDNAVQIQNNSSSPLALTGNVSLGANTATLNGSGATSLSGNITGTGSIVQSGTGTDTLSGTNTYSGGTTLSAGTLVADSNTALGTGAVMITGGTLASTNTSTISNILTLAGNATFSGITTNGTLTQSGADRVLNLASATQSGGVKLSESNTGRTLTVQVDSGSSSISGVIANGGTGAGNVTKTGSGTLILSGANTYTGSTAINAGTLQLGASNVLPSTTNLTIAASGALNLNGFSDQVGNLTASGGGATIDFGTVSGNNTFVFGKYTPPPSGVLVVNNYVLGNDTLATTVATASQGTNGTQTINNSVYISGYGLATENTSTSPTLYGSAYLLTPAAQTWNYWDGSGGTTWSTKGNWSTTVNPTQTTPGSAPNAAGALVNIGNFTTTNNPTLTAGATVGGMRFDPNASRSYTVGGAFTLTMSQTAGPAYIQQQSAFAQTIGVSTVALNSDTVADVTGAGNLTISSALSGSKNLVKDGTGAGKLILSGNSSAYTGGVYINNGVLQAANTNALGTATTTIADGATLELSGGISPTNAIAVTGSGVSAAGAIHNVGGTNTLAGTITESGATTVAADTGTTLSLTGNLTGANTNTTFASAGTGAINVNQITTGTGGVTVNGATVTFQGGTTANTYTGVTTVNSGTLNLSKTAGTTAIAGSLTINGGTVNETTSNQIATAAPVAVNGGTFALGTNVSNSFSSINSAAGGTISLGSGATMTVNSTSSNALSGAITGAGALATAGSGTVTLGGSNTYSGGTTVASIVTPLSNNSFGSGAVTVNSGGSIETQNTVALANNFTLSSTGTTAYNGAIENISGNSTLTGTISLAGTSRLQSDSGTLTASNTVALGANTLSIGGAGNTTLSGAITGAAGSSLVKDGAGTLTLSGNNTFAGSLLVSAGQVLAQASTAFNSANQLTISSGATLGLNGFNETVASFNNSGTVNLGGSTLTLASGGSITGSALTGSGTLIIGSGASLTLSGSINNPNLNIILNGGSLFLNGTSDRLGSIQVTGNSVLDFGSTSASALNATSFSVNSAVTLSITNWTNGVDYFYSSNFSGAVPDLRGAAPQNQVGFSGYANNSTVWQSYDHQITPAPEPATYGMLMIGAALGALGLRRYRTSRRNRAPLAR